MLHELSLKEQYKVIGRELYAVIEETGERRQVNEDGCELAKSEKEKIAANDQTIAELTDRINKLELENKARQIFIGELLSCGFCTIDKKIQERDSITGHVINEYMGHQYYCRNKRKV